MNSVYENQYDLFRYYQAVRGELLGILPDEDLAFSPGGHNPTLGWLCREIGQVQGSYIDSFKTFKQEWSYPDVTPALDSSTEQLEEWYGRLDIELEEVISGLTEDQVQNQAIDRGGDFQVRPGIQLEIYKEALLIFYGKTAVYLKAMGKELPDQMAEWIT